MAEFQEVMRQKKRMCNSVLCCRCDIYRLCGEDLSKCSCFITNNPKKAEKVIMSWAAEHPEPVYPTWYEFLTSKYPAAWDIIAHYPIPADIAEKLGIEPKEG